jgi:hypothetical protein
MSDKEVNDEQYSESYAKRLCHFRSISEVRIWHRIYFRDSKDFDIATAIKSSISASPDHATGREIAIVKSMASRRGAPQYSTGREMTHSRVVMLLTTRQQRK